MRLIASLAFLLVACGGSTESTNPIDRVARYGAGGVSSGSGGEGGVSTFVFAPMPAGGSEGEGGSHTVLTSRPTSEGGSSSSGGSQAGGSSALEAGGSDTVATASGGSSGVGGGATGGSAGTAGASPQDAGQDAYGIDAGSTLTYYLAQCEGDWKLDELCVGQFGEDANYEWVCPHEQGTVTLKGAQASASFIGVEGDQRKTQCYFMSFVGQLTGTADVSRDVICCARSAQ